MIWLKHYSGAQFNHRNGPSGQACPICFYSYSNTLFISSLIRNESTCLLKQFCLCYTSFESVASVTSAVGHKHYMTLCVINHHSCDYRVYSSVFKWNGMIEKIKNKKQHCIMWNSFGHKKPTELSCYLKAGVCVCAGGGAAFIIKMQVCLRTQMQG